MGLRPGRCYRERMRSWSRTAKRAIESAYIVGVPDSKIKIFDLGNKARLHDFAYRLDLRVGETCQMRDNALEAARVMANKVLEENLGLDNFFFKIFPYPHHVLREHASLTGAGADRLSKGMKLAFGRPIGRAIQVNEDQVILSIWVDEEGLAQAKDAIRRARTKLTGHCYSEISQLKAPKKLEEDAVAA